MGNNGWIRLCLECDKMDSLQESIRDGIKSIFDTEKARLKFDYTLIGKVISIASDNKSCMVEINGSESKCLIRDGVSFSVNDVVMVKVMKNNYSDKIVDGKIGTRSV